MLCLSKRVEYALIALAHLAEQPQCVASAREISARHSLPAQMLMNILKTLQNHGVLKSTRGVKGGYQINPRLDSLFLSDLVSIVDCSGHAGGGDCGCMNSADLDTAAEPPVVAVTKPITGPIEALHLRLNRFLKEIKLADLVWPGRRIDVPSEKLSKRTQTPRAAGLVAAAPIRSL